MKVKIFGSDGDSLALEKAINEFIHRSVLSMVVCKRSRHL